MIDIQVNGLVKSFEVGQNILDGITFQIDQGQRVGLLGKNGAGKSTLFKILTGELEYDEGTVTIAPGRRIGLISQIPVYPDGYTVEDVLRSAFDRLHTLAAEMESLAERMAAGKNDPALLKRYGSLAAMIRTLPSAKSPTASPSRTICGDVYSTAFPAVKRPASIWGV